LESQIRGRGKRQIPRNRYVIKVETVYRARRVTAQRLCSEKGGNNGYLGNGEDDEADFGWGVGFGSVDGGRSGRAQKGRDADHTRGDGPLREKAEGGGRVVLPVRVKPIRLGKNVEIGRKGGERAEEAWKKLAWQ